MISIGTSFEYDLSEEGDGAFWYRTGLTPDLFSGVSILDGYRDDGDDATDAELIYGEKYKCSDKLIIAADNIFGNTPEMQKELTPGKVVFGMEVEL